MSLSNRRRDLSPSRGGVGSSKLRMDRQPVVARITGRQQRFSERKFFFPFHSKKLCVGLVC